MVLPLMGTAGVVTEPRLESIGVEPRGDVHWNLESSELGQQALLREEGRLTAHGVFLAETGERTGRSPHDRFIVDETPFTDAVWWGDVNRPIAREGYLELKAMVIQHLSSSNQLHVQDLACGADPNLRLPISLLKNSACHANFARNIFILITPQ